MRKNILISSIIAMAILVLVSITSAIDVNTNNDKENKPIDSTIEIISFIKGTCWHEPGGGIGFMRNIVLDGNPVQAHLHFISLAINPLRLISVQDLSLIHIPLFFGVIGLIYPLHYFVRGVAFGNIDWWE